MICLTELGMFNLGIIKHCFPQYVLGEDQAQQEAILF